MKIFKVLIADDEELLQDLYEMILESECTCETVKVSSGAEAIQALTNQSDFDLIISDYYMPQSSGGKIYLFNKSHQNIPFFIFTGGDISDFSEFNDFYESNNKNLFFAKPFDDSLFTAAIHRINQSRITNSSQTESIELNIDYIKVKLSFYTQNVKRSGEVFIKLNDDKYTKIIFAHSEEQPDSELLNHYIKKDIEYIYLKKGYFKLFLLDAFDNLHQQVANEKKPYNSVALGNLNFLINLEGLNDIGITTEQIEQVNQVINMSIDLLLNNSENSGEFLKLCEKDGFIVAHSTLIMYLAGAICKKTNLDFISIMKKICTAAFYHDLSLLNLDIDTDILKLSEIENEKLLELIIYHPQKSADLILMSNMFIDDIKKIILEHHELPLGNGYPRQLSASQISPLSCLFILSQNIAHCLVRNNFSRNRLKDYLQNSKNEFNQGNFCQFFKIAENIF